VRLVAFGEVVFFAHKLGGALLGQPSIRHSKHIGLLKSGVSFNFVTVGWRRYTSPWARAISFA
jgi:hypothetical protein